MVLELIEQQGGESHGVVTRVARQLGVGTGSLRNWVREAEVDSGQRLGTTREDKRYWRRRTGSRDGRTRWRVQAVAATTCA